ncbi:hypothetical protein LguiB_003577 [Lonicera macranthoides]
MALEEVCLTDSKDVNKRYREKMLRQKVQTYRMNGYYCVARAHWPTDLGCTVGLSVAHFCYATKKIEERIKEKVFKEVYINGRTKGTNNICIDLFVDNKDDDDGGGGGHGGVGR